MAIVVEGTRDQPLSREALISYLEEQVMSEQKAAGYLLNRFVRLDGFAYSLEIAGSVDPASGNRLALHLQTDVGEELYAAWPRQKNADPTRPSWEDPRLSRTPFGPLKILVLMGRIEYDDESKTRLRKARRQYRQKARARDVEERRNLLATKRQRYVDTLAHATRENLRLGIITQDEAESILGDIVKTFEIEPRITITPEEK